MKKKLLLWTLAGVNAALLISLSFKLMGENTAMGQAAPPRRPADYIMIPGQIASGNFGVVYLVDTTNGLLGAMAYNDSLQRLEIMPPLNLNRVFNPTPPAARPVHRGY